MDYTQKQLHSLLIERTLLTETATDLDCLSILLQEYLGVDGIILHYDKPLCDTPLVYSRGLSESFVSMYGSDLLHQFDPNLIESQILSTSSIASRLDESCVDRILKAPASITPEAWKARNLFLSKLLAENGIVDRVAASSKKNGIRFSAQFFYVCEPNEKDLNTTISVLKLLVDVFSDQTIELPALLPRVVYQKIKSLWLLNKTREIESLILGLNHIPLSDQPKRFTSLISERFSCKYQSLVQLD